MLGADDEINRRRLWSSKDGRNRSKSTLSIQQAQAFDYANALGGSKHTYATLSPPDSRVRDVAEI